MNEQPAMPIKILRAILIALMFGLVMVTGVALFMRTQMDAAAVPEAQTVLPIVVAVVLASSVGVVIVLRARFFALAAKDREASLKLLREEKVPQPLGVATILSAALFEAPGLLGAVTVLIGGPLYCLAGPVLAIVAMAWLLPSRERFEEELRSSA